MTKHAETPRSYQIHSVCRSIRAHWTGAKRRDRRLQAISKQRHLLQRLLRSGASAL
jgi:hypothetical protein